MLSAKAAKLLMWLHSLQVNKIDIDELKKLTGLSKTAIRNGIHELQEEGHLTIWD